MKYTKIFFAKWCDIRVAFLFFFCFVFIFIFCFLGLHPQHMEVPRLGVQLELWPLAYARVTAMQDPSHVCDLHHSSQQLRILNPLSQGLNLRPHEY